MNVKSIYIIQYVSNIEPCGESKGVIGGQAVVMLSD
jgi:hypothetical protein